MVRFTDRIALVTGASRGLGYATACALGARGAHVICLARTTGGLEEVADAVESAGGSTTLVPLDVTDEGGLQRMCRAIFDRWGRLDLLVHCAIHATPLSPADSVGEKDLDRAIAVNFRATQRLIALTHPLLKLAADGRAVFIQDVQAGKKFFASYGASKAGQQALVDSYAAETAQIGPTVCSFAPNPMATSLRARFFPGEDRSLLSPPMAEAERLIQSLS